MLDKRRRKRVFCIYMKLIEVSVIYMDVCALERPYDDQKYYRIRMESVAVELLLSKVRQKKIVLYYSPVHENEIALDGNETRKMEVSLFLRSCARYAKSFIKDNDRLEQRGWELRKAGLGIADAFHMAYAEMLSADFITCDDNLLKKVRRCKATVWCGTPVDYCQKENVV
jgi:predicted nucleic acid-binding protein